MRSRSVGAAGLFTLLAAVASLVPAYGQQAAADAAERPVIGLVLSGGGARGGAHIGVIRALEELRVPVDVISGTSIGAAIGGLYASGMTVDEIEAFVNGIDWDAAFLNSTPRELKSFRRKREDDLFLLQQRPGIDRDGISLPAGVVQGQVIDAIMTRVTMPVSGIDSFDDLTIPFRAVAGDIETGEAVVLSEGSLALAIRASMSVPAAFTPVVIDDKDLVDGGIVMNLPVEVAQSMGAERIVAVDISEKLKAREDIQSVVDITTQLTNMLTARGTDEQLERLTAEDILLTPVFTDEYGSVDFGRLTETVEMGYAVAMENRELFEPYRLTDSEYSAWRAGLPDIRETTLPAVEFVRYDDTEPLSQGIVEARMQDIPLGEPLELDVLERSMNRVYGLGIYQNVRYSLVEEEGRHGLDFDFIQRSWGPSYVQLGLRYASASDEDTHFGLAASYLSTGINERGGEWRATFLLGDEPGFFTDRYEPLGTRGLWFANPAFDVSSNRLNIYSDNQLVTELKLRSAIFEFGGGRELLDWAEIRGGFRVGAGDTRLHVGDPTFVPYDSFHRGEFFTRVSVDTLDNISFPRSGMFATVEWLGSNETVLGSGHDYDQLLIRGAHARTWGRHTVLATLRSEATISGVSPAYALFGIGGFRDLSGFNRWERTGQHVTRLGASYYRRIGDLALLPAFVGFSAEVGNVWESRSDISLNDSVWAGSIWAGVDTPVGPVFLAWGNAEGGDDAFYVFLGRLF